jgi:hypothetical protein
VGNKFGCLLNSICYLAGGIKGVFQKARSKMNKKNLTQCWLSATVLCLFIVNGNPALADSPGQQQINWLENMQDLHTTGLLESYENNGDTKAWVNDQALAIIAFTAAGEFERARKILNTMKDIQLADSKKSWFECYNAVDGAYMGCWKHVTGPIAWMVIAINFYEDKTGDTTYASMAQLALEWLDTMMRKDNPSDERYGSLQWSDSDPDIISTEHNHDAYSAYYWRGILDSNSSYLYKASLIYDYLQREMWAPSPNSNGPYHNVNIFWEGFNNFAFSTDPQSWGILSLGPRGPEWQEEFYKSLDWIWYSPWGNTRTVQDYNESITDVEGFKSGTGEPYDYVWVDGTEHVAAAFYSVGDDVKGDFFHNQMKRVVNANGGLVHSFCEVDPNNMRWPENYRYNYVASAAWYYFNEVRLNPFNLRPCMAECRRAEIDEITPVNLKDFAILALNWLHSGSDLAGDINGDEIVSRPDIILLSAYWLWDCNN